MTLKSNLTEDRLRALDPQDMLGKTLELPQQILEGMRLGREIARHRELERPRALDWIGLGGSAVAGDLLQGFGFAPPAWPLTIRVRRAWQPSPTKKLFCSYSGNTIETVRAFEEAKREEIWLSMSSGGKLKELAAKKRTPHVTLPAGYPPRAAVGYVIGAMLGIFEKLHDREIEPSGTLWQDLATDASAYRVLDENENAALSLAIKLVNHTPVIYAADGLTMPSVAFRFRAQLAENGKTWSHSADLPELAHNEVEALHFLSQLLPPPLVILLGSWPNPDKFTDPRPGLRTLLNSLKIAHITFDPQDIWGESHSRLAFGLRTMLLLDAATVYLAVMRSIDPLEIPVITRLKESGGLA